MSEAGGSQSGNPCARLIALYCVAMRDIPRMTDSENTEVRCEVLGMVGACRDNSGDFQFHAGPQIAQALFITSRLAS